MHRKLRSAAALAACALALAAPSALAGHQGEHYDGQHVTFAGQSAWFSESLGFARGGFVRGPGTPPYGSGSYQLAAGPSETAAQHTLWHPEYQRFLAGVSALGYSTYSHQGLFPALKIEANTGTEQFLTTLVFDPPASAIVRGQWQHWDAFALPYWRSTRDLEGYPNSECHCDLRTLSEFVAKMPGATFGAHGLHVGIGGTGALPTAAIGNVDGIYLALNRARTYWDFEEKIEL